MNKWIEFNSTWGEFYRAKLNNVGTLVETDDGSKYLIGDVNEYGGVCDDCTELKYGIIIRRYKIAWSPENE